MYEGGIRVPLVVKAPGVTGAGSTSDAVVTSTDFYPTLLELVGIPRASSQCPDGVSILPALEGKTFDRGPVYWHYPHYGNQGGRPGGAVRDGNWKLIEWYGEDNPQLFDLSTDIGEQLDLGKQHPDQRDRLQRMLVAWREKLGAKMPQAATPPAP